MEVYVEVLIDVQASQQCSSKDGGDKCEDKGDRK